MHTQIIHDPTSQPTQIRPVTILAIDPGASGGIAWMHPGNPVEASAMPSTPGEILSLLRKIIAQAGGANQVTAYLEQVGGFIPGRPQPASRAFNFGMGYGFLQGFLMAMEIRTELVTPQRWQASLHMGNSHGLAKAEWKRKLKVKAEQFYPGLSITLATADAILILDYAIHQGIQVAVL